VATELLLHSMFFSNRERLCEHTELIRCIICPFRNTSAVLMYAVHSEEAGELLENSSMI
jgi:hypothetical protein